MFKLVPVFYSVKFNNLPLSESHLVAQHDISGLLSFLICKVQFIFYVLIIENTFPPIP